MEDGTVGDYHKSVHFHYEDTGHSENGSIEFQTWKDASLRDSNGSLKGIPSQHFAYKNVPWADLKISELGFGAEDDPEVKEVIKRAGYLELSKRASEEKRKKDAGLEYDSEIEWYSDAVNDEDEEVDEEVDEG